MTFTVVSVMPNSPALLFSDLANPNKHRALGAVSIRIAPEFAQAHHFGGAHGLEQPNIYRIQNPATGAFRQESMEPDFLLARSRKVPVPGDGEHRERDAAAARSR